MLIFIYNSWFYECLKSNLVCLPNSVSYNSKFTRKKNIFWVLSQAFWFLRGAIFHAGVSFISRIYSSQCTTHIIVFTEVMTLCAHIVTIRCRALFLCASPRALGGGLQLGGGRLPALVQNHHPLKSAQRVARAALVLAEHAVVQHRQLQNRARTLDKI